MLAELTIRNFAVIRETRIEFTEGLNVLTGETGAGKSIVLDALSTVLGARVSSDLVRSGEERAYVEGAFFSMSEFRDSPISELLCHYGIELDKDEPLILSRDITATGRSTARVNGRTLTATALSDISEYLVDIHGQSDHLSLLRPAKQLEILDRYAGTLALRSRVAQLYSEWRNVRGRLDSFSAEQRERAQRLDLLKYQSEEIARAALQPGEDEELRRERSVLVNAERLSTATADSYRIFSGDEDIPGQVSALDQIRSADVILEQMAGMDSSLATISNQIREALFALEEASLAIRSYGEQLQFDPERLEEIDDRLETIRELTRKYGPSIEDVLNFLDGIGDEIEALEEQDIDVDSLHHRVDEAAGELATVARLLSERRREAGKRMSRHVEETVAELNMGRAEFQVRFSTTADPSGIAVDGKLVAIDESGIDRVSFFLAANRGEELRPLARVASGGETARLMLAMKSILSEADETPILVFDEIDVGIGGRSGQVVGVKLWGLTSSHQVIVISHLPQIAAFADRHISMVKFETDDRTETSAVVLDEEASVDEIATMFDGIPVSPESRANALALLDRVNRWKHDASASILTGSATLL